ncbi:AAA family ATPase [Serratia marcescens]|uniref:AAA family ATPase n=2 Tax=Serratia marcescens TaxID=615 RepID=UPI0013DBEE7B|nr:AAA family ATPase [Serratia marcescens]BEM16268.1 hypothetical protein SM14VA7_40940 [Serratia marcescens]
MIKLKEFNISHFWSEKNVKIKFNKKFSIITGHNGSGKSTVLEFLHDTFSLIHDGKPISLHTHWASEAKFIDRRLVRNFSLGRNKVESKDTRLKIQEIAKKGIGEKIDKNFDEILKFIKDNLNSKNEKDNHLVQKESGSSSPENYFFYLLYNPKNTESKLPRTIMFRDDQFYYNDSVDDKKKLEELDIFIKENSINKTLYLLLNEFLSQESMNKQKQKHYSKEDLKNEIIKELTNTKPKEETPNTIIKDHFISSLDDIIDKIYNNYQRNSSTPWGQKFFEALDKFITTTNRTITRDEKGLIAFKLPNNKVVKWYNFSRGEKTLVSILLNVFLNRNKDIIFILDEPDLSLHIEWQELLLPTLSELASRRQFIISTHSPALIGNVDEQYINITAAME